MTLNNSPLWKMAITVTQRALASGALLPIPTHYEIVNDDGVPFLVRCVHNLARKQLAGSSEKAVDGQKLNPFLPYDPELFVADVGDTHVCLLNKFNVVEHHLLIVTRHFEHQETALNESDFSALWQCLQQIDGLGFYNGGKIAGASQPHKHLQLVPLPLAPEGPWLPIEVAWQEELPTAGIQTFQFRSLPFAHAWMSIEDLPLLAPPQMATNLCERYRQMLVRIGGGFTAETSPRATIAYNLLMTRRWMLLVPRRYEKFKSISMNSLAFAGAMLARDQDRLNSLKRHGPMEALRHVAAVKKSNS